MTAIPPGKTHKVTIIVRGPKDKKVVKAYMKKIRRAVGRSSRLSQTKPTAARRRKRR
jgi:hypothetical protein